MNRIRENLSLFKIVSLFLDINKLKKSTYYLSNYILKYLIKNLKDLSIILTHLNRLKTY